MIAKSVLIICIVVLITSIKLTTYVRVIENELLQSFKYNVNQSCKLCLGNDFGCDTLDFQLDYKRHREYGQLANYIYIFHSITNCFFNYFWSIQKNDKVFFGSLKLNNTQIHAVAKSPGYIYSEMFDQNVLNISYDIHTKITNHQQNLLQFSTDIHNLVICSKDDIKYNNLLYNFFSSVINSQNSINSQLLVEAWTAAHLSVELLILRVLNGHKYVPKLYKTCGRVYFVEDCGYTLQYHLINLNLNNRLLVARELLKLALELSDGTAHPKYSFYLSDLTADNIAVQFDKNTKLLQSLKVIDWSDVIVVANNHSSITSNKLMHMSENVDCGIGCLIYSQEDICQAHVSDHNIYAVCKEFLSGEDNLLHETNLKSSKELHKKEEKLLQSLLNECLWHSDQSNESRFDIAKSIIKLIQNIVKHSFNY